MLTNCRRPWTVKKAFKATLDIFRAEASSSVWKQANKNPIKLTKTPLSGVVEEGHAYFFRVRAFNRWGQGPASMPIGPIALRDSGTFRHPMGNNCFL